MAIEKDDAGNSTQTLKECCFGQREIIKNIAGTVQELFKHPDLAMKDSEVIANLKLAYRHLEDARMRVGKAVQALDDGQSCYPR